MGHHRAAYRSGIRGRFLQRQALQRGTKEFAKGV